MVEVLDRDTSHGPTRGEWVKYLQRLLELAGYWAEGITGDYGPELENAVKRFQSDHGLEPDGTVLGSTWAALARIPSESMTSVDWEHDYSEIYSVAASEDFADYMRRVVEIDPEVFEDDADEPA